MTRDHIYALQNLKGRSGILNLVYVCSPKVEAIPFITTNHLSSTTVSPQQAYSSTHLVRYFILISFLYYSSLAQNYHMIFLQLQLSAGSLQHIESGYCWHPHRGSSLPSVNTRLVLHPKCNENRLKFTIIRRGEI